jgi:hypothetical protein
MDKGLDNSGPAPRLSIGGELSSVRCAEGGSGLFSGAYFHSIIFQGRQFYGQ